MSMFKSTLNPAWPHILGISFTLLACLIGVGRQLLVGWTDPMHCEALLNNGIWLDSEHNNWQPNGCMLHSYTEDEATSCLRSREIIFIGDSVTRKLFFQTAQSLDASLPSSPPDKTQRHSNHKFSTKHGTNISFSWDPFLNGSYTHEIINGVRSNETTRPALLVLGSGLWYLRYANTSGGISAWESNMEQVFNSITRPQGPADKVVVLPVGEVAPSKLSPERTLTMHPFDIDAMNSDLYHRINPPSDDFGHVFSKTRNHDVFLPLVFNQMLEESLTEDGLHYSDSVVKIQARILMNLRCNSVLPKTFPLDKTCCNSYPVPSIPQMVSLLVVLLLGPYAIYKGFKSGSGSIGTVLCGQQARSTFIIGCSIALIYLADRSNFWQKEQKQFDSLSFGFLLILALVIGLATVKRGEADLGFLNREQTQEWKGWMQIAILIYHYFRASQISGIYNPIRVLVASYLFMTGYGNTTYYLRKADYGFIRIAQVLIRLNLFTIILAYTLNTDYISYYFTPLVSMWYIVIYITMVAGARFNDRTSLLILKIFLSAAFMTWFMDKSWLLEIFFDVLNNVFAIHWSSREWAFRVNLDIWIVYGGMLTSVISSKIREHRLVDHAYWPWLMKGSIGFSVLTVFWFFGFELLQESKFAYNKWHPYISILPVLAFVILRNSSVALRSSASRAFVFVGNCSLESFIIQYHFWMAGDSKGVLLVIPGTRWRPVNFVITSIMFLYLCDRVSFAVAEITSRVCGLRTREPQIPMTTPVFDAATEGLLAEEQEITVSLTPLQHGLKDDSGNPLPIEPDTPIRPARWVERLSETSSRSSSTRFSNPFFNTWTFTLAVRLAAFLAGLWILNLVWPYPASS